MKRFLLSMLVVLSAAVAFGKTIYVVSVGIADYKYINDLRNTENDARDVANLYKTHTNNVKLLVGAQATHDNILSTLRTFFAQAREDDQVVFFFSGHGGKTGLCPYDTRSEKTLLTYTEIQGAIRGCKAKTKLLFIDSCFSGGLRESKKKNTASASTNSSPMQGNTEGVMLFLSSRNNEESKETPFGKNGVFTRYLLKGIKGEADANKDRIITAKELFQYVAPNVSSYTKKQQNPVMWGKFNDNMHIMNWNPKR